MELVQQKYKLDCGVACMAMLLHCSYDKAASYFHKDFETDDMNEKELCEAIQTYGKRVIMCDIFDPMKEQIVIVPSLNNIGDEHVVCWTGSEVFDPNKNRQGKKIYSDKLFTLTTKRLSFSLC